MCVFPVIEVAHPRFMYVREEMGIEISIFAVCSEQKKREVYIVVESCTPVGILHPKFPDRDTIYVCIHCVRSMRGNRVFRYVRWLHSDSITFEILTPPPTPSTSEQTEFAVSRYSSSMRCSRRVPGPRVLARAQASSAARPNNANPLVRRTNVRALQASANTRVHGQ
jgi:hypothetical protein